MTNLYLIFFLVGIVLFCAVVAYSYVQQQNSNRKKRTLEESAEPEAEAKVERRQAPTLKAESKEQPSRKADSIQAKQPATRSRDAELTGDEAKARDNDESSAMSRAKSALSALRRGSEAKSKTEKPSKLVAKPAEPQEPTIDSPAPATKETVKPSSEPSKVVTDADSVITDLVARVLNPNPIEQSDLLSLFREHDFKFHRKVHIYGLNELTDMWRDVELELPSARFLELGISIQLCDREGAMSEKEMHDFQQMVLQFCEKYDAPFEFSMDLEAALQQAQALDQIGRRYDSMAVLNVVPKSKSGFRMADIQSCARDLMMSSDKNGIFMKTEGQKNNITVLYRLACTDGEGHFGVQATGSAAATPVHDLVVYMNVPSTRDPEAVFQQMVSDANDLATWLDGRVVDRAGKAMNQRSYSTLMQQISDIAFSMQRDGLTPGDAVSKKLF